MPMLISAAARDESREKDITDEYALHVLHRDDTGLLTYKKVYFNSTEAISINSGNGFAFGGIEELEANMDASNNNINESQYGLDESGRLQHQTNSGDRAYEQMRFDKNKLTYFLNSDGNIVARFNHNFEYAAAQDGATENWIG
jgi:hypothetical protein